MKVELFENIEIRRSEKDGRSYLSIVDCCNGLGYKNPTHASSQLFNQYRDELIENSTILESRTVDGKMRQLTFLDIEGVVLLCMFSRQPKAKLFRKWAKKVLAEKIQNKKVPTYPEALRGWADSLERAEKAESVLEEAKPKIAYADVMLDVKGDITFRELADKIGPSCGEEKLKDYLVEKGIVIEQKYKPNKYITRRYFHPSHDYKDWFNVVDTQGRDKGKKTVYTETLITPKGATRIIHLWMKDHPPKQLPLL